MNEIDHLIKTVTEVAVRLSQEGNATEDVNSISERNRTWNITETGIIIEGRFFHVGSKGCCSEDKDLSTDVNDQKDYFNVAWREEVVVTTTSRGLILPKNILRCVLMTTELIVKVANSSCAVRPEVNNDRFVGLATVESAAVGDELSRDTNDFK